jgi:hypothetical protein
MVESTNEPDKLNELRLALRRQLEYEPRPAVFILKRHAPGVKLTAEELVDLVNEAFEFVRQDRLRWERTHPEEAAMLKSLLDNALRQAPRLW